MRTKIESEVQEYVERLIGDVAGAPASDVYRTAGQSVDVPLPPTAEPAGEALGPNHPLAPLAGKYNDAPWWDEYLAAIDEYRKEVNESDSLG